MKKLLAFVLLLIGILFFTSCLDRKFVKGKVEIISVTDTTLNDSSIIVGHVYRLQDSNTNRGPIQNAKIWIENSTLSNTSNTTGYYYIKITPEIYTIKCQDNGSPWPQMIEEINNI